MTASNLKRSPGMFNPALPYAGTSGHSGTDTSEARAKQADSDGTTTARQMETLSALRYAGSDGLTWSELAEALGLHHGQASGTLSVLHKAGQIERLKLSRNRCKIYVIPDHVDGRLTEPFAVKQSMPKVPAGSMAIVLPAEIVEKLARGAVGNPLSMPPAIADILRSASRDSVQALADQEQALIA